MFLPLSKKTTVRSRLYSIARILEAYCRRVTTIWLVVRFISCGNCGEVYVIGSSGSGDSFQTSSNSCIIVSNKSFESITAAYGLP